MFFAGFFEGPDKWNTSITTFEYATNLLTKHHFRLWRIPVHLVKPDGTPYKTILMSSNGSKIQIIYQF